MKKIALILFSLLCLVFGLLAAIYWTRKSKIDEQLVSKRATEILAIDVDEIILDNLSRFLSWNKKETAGKENKDNWLYNILFDAGIEIPSRLYLFNINPQEYEFYGILKVKNYDACFTFFATHFSDKMIFVDKGKGVVQVKINSYVALLFDRKHMLYTFSQNGKTADKDLQRLLNNQGDWTAVSSLKNFKGLAADHHIIYTQKDQKLYLEGDLNKGEFHFQGTWQLAHGLKDELFVSDRDRSKQIFRFWNLLDIEEIPALSNLIKRFSGLSEEEFSQHYGQYYEAQVNDIYSIQRDSSITYVYDDNFNAQEQYLIKENKIPQIVQTWKYSKPLSAALPDKMWYQFQQKHTEDYIIQCTDTTVLAPTNKIATDTPLFAFVDFERWPAAWTFSFLKPFIEKKVKASLKTKIVSENTLSVEGLVTETYP